MPSIPGRGRKVVCRAVSRNGKSERAADPLPGIAGRFRCPGVRDADSSARKTAGRLSHPVFDRRQDGLDTADHSQRPRTAQTLGGKMRVSWCVDRIEYPISPHAFVAGKPSK